MYKIYINEMPVNLIKSEMVGSINPSNSNIIVIPYLGKPNVLHQIIKLSEPPYTFDEIFIYSHTPEQILKALKSEIKEIIAGGGIVFNEFNEVLFIYRRGYWDLPKGKHEKNESIEQTSIREVEEETGISGLQLGRYLGDTYHLFKTQRNGNYFLKKTYWYKMTTHKQQIKVQKEEDIDDAVWLPIPTFLKECKPTFNNILDILKRVN
ncbi:MAG: NUDIX domain-containing protein [Saprospiraceae bacterium]|nr:NUDIX domain-containing protein [Saprospiraceae bacterium]